MNFLLQKEILEKINNNCKPSSIRKISVNEFKDKNTSPFNLNNIRKLTCDLSGEGESDKTIDKDYKQQHENNRVCVAKDNNKESNDVERNIGVNYDYVNNNRGNSRNPISRVEEKKHKRVKYSIEEYKKNKKSKHKHNYKKILKVVNENKKTDPLRKYRKQGGDKNKKTEKRKIIEDFEGNNKKDYNQGKNIFSILQFVKIYE